MTDHDLIANIHRRMDSQDEMLREIRDKVVDNSARFDEHLKAEKEVKPAIEELLALWKGSKIIIPALASIAAMAWAVFSWANDHIK